MKNLVQVPVRPVVVLRFAIQVEGASLLPSFSLNHQRLTI